MPQPSDATLSTAAEHPSHSPHSSPLSLFERRGLPAIKLTIPKALGVELHADSSNISSSLLASDQMTSTLSSSSKSPTSASVPSATANSSDIPPFNYNSTLLSSSDRRRESIASMNSAKYSLNSLLEDANPADRKTLTQLFALMDKLSMEIQLDLGA